MATIIIPTPLRKFTNNQSKLAISGNNIKEAISQLALTYPDLKKHLLDDSGNIRSFINIFIESDDIRNLQQENTVVKEESVISIIPAIAGGLNRSLLCGSC